MSNSPVPTPHIAAKKEDIARTVLMPGDPLRAKFIAETYLDDAFEFNNIRGMLGYTGSYKGKRVSVMGSGMGIPSMGLYSYELFNFYEVENIIRIGTAGGMAPQVKLRDVVIGMGACTNSNYAHQFRLPGAYAPIASYELLERSINAARKLGASFHVGNILTSDFFYGDDENAAKMWLRMGVLAVEMESAGLYMNAARAGKNALCMYTISDCIFTGEETTSEERQNSFTTMMEIALETAI